MRAPADEAAHTGGIASMLQVADLCLQCGQDHGVPRTSLRHRGPTECPSVVMGSFPVLPVIEADLEELPPVPASRRIRDFEHPAPATTPVAPVSISWGRREDESRHRPLAIPWLPLPDLGEVL